MGTTFWSFHVENGDPQRIWSALTDGGPALIERTPTAGWCSVYPKDMGRAQKLARVVSTALATRVLFVQVYDSDVCDVVLYNEGKRVTRFANEGDDHPAEAGDAKRFAKYARRANEAAIRAVLDQTPVFAEDFAIGLAELFGLERDRVVYAFGWRGESKAARERRDLVLAE